MRKKDLLYCFFGLLCLSLHKIESAHKAMEKSNSQRAIPARVSSPGVEKSVRLSAPKVRFRRVTVKELNDRRVPVYKYLIS